MRAPLVVPRSTTFAAAATAVTTPWPARASRSKASRVKRGGPVSALAASLPAKKAREAESWGGGAAEGASLRQSSRRDIGTSAQRPSALPHQALASEDQSRTK
jgi:hypothetical protein